MTTSLAPILSAFGITCHKVESLNVGLINKTYLAEDQTGALYILQSLNPSVFKDPVAVQRNTHLALGILRQGGLKTLPTLIATESGQHLHDDGQSQVWRLFTFVSGSRTLEVLQNKAQAYEAGRVLGQFHRLLAKSRCEEFAVTIPGFHDTRAIYATFLQTLAEDPLGRLKDITAEEIAFFKARHAYSEVFSEAAKAGTMTLRICHGDPKVSNILYAERKDKALCLVDLDTVMPGYWLVDFGDLVRSGARLSGEDAGQADFSQEFFNSIKTGYIAEMASLLSPAEVALLNVAPRVIAFELALRFITDYLQGDVYFASPQRGDNLRKFRGQKNLLEEMEKELGPDARAKGP